MVRNFRRRSARRRLFAAPRTTETRISSASNASATATILLEGTLTPTPGIWTSFMPGMVSLFMRPDRLKPFFTGIAGMASATACWMLAREKVIGIPAPVRAASTLAFKGPLSPVAGLICQLKAGASPLFSLAVCGPFGVIS